MKSVAIVGVGRVGGALAIACSKAGLPVTELVYRSPDLAAKIADHITPSPALSASEQSTPITADIVIIATRDPEIAQAAEIISDRLRPGQIVLHTSGSLTSSALSGLAGRVVEIGSMHPLLAISDPIAGAASFAGSFFCLEGTTAAVGAGERIASQLGARSFTVEAEFKALYHASAVMTAGHFVALFDAATRMLEQCGLDDQTARDVLLPLAESTLNNLKHYPSEAALTGPYARFDEGAVERHLESFAEVMDKSILSIYLELALHSLTIAEKLSPDGAVVERVRSRLSIAKESLR